MIKLRKESMRKAIEYFINNEDIYLKDCANKFGVDTGTLRRNLKSMDVKTNRYKKRFNEDYFETIDTEEKAYWLGFILADGSIEESRSILSIALSSVDKDHLKKMVKAIDGNHNINEYMANNNVMNKRYATSDLSISSKKMIKDLSKLNIVANKTKNEKPTELREDLIRHYIRGFYDGDGWISSYNRRPQDRCKNKKWELGFASSFEMIDYISKHLEAALDISYKEPKLNHIYRIRYSSNNDIAKIIEYLYKDATVYLERKYTKAEEFCRPKTKPQKS